MYNVSFTVTDNHPISEFCGFSINDQFDPGYNMNTLFHDIFEHFFENSEYFRTKELSQAGECVAMGIRTYLDENSHLVNTYASYNKYHGVYWNSWNTIIGQVGENLDPDSHIEYPNDFDFEHLPDWHGENYFEGMVEAYNEHYDISDELAHDIERAVSYGYWLGEYLFDDMLDTIDDFCANLKQFLHDYEFENMGEFDTSPFNYFKLYVSVKRNEIKAIFHGHNGHQSFRQKISNKKYQYKLEYI